MKCYSRNVPDEGYSRNVPDEGYSRNVPDEVSIPETYLKTLLYTPKNRNVPDDFLVCYSRNVPDEGFVIPETYLMNIVIPETYLMKVIPETYLMNRGYSFRNKRLFQKRT